MCSVEVKRAVCSDGSAAIPQADCIQLELLTLDGAAFFQRTSGWRWRFGGGRLAVIHNHLLGIEDEVPVSSPPRQVFHFLPVYPLVSINTFSHYGP